MTDEPEDCGECETCELQGVCCGWLYLDFPEELDELIGAD